MDLHLHVDVRLIAWLKRRRLWIAVSLLTAGAAWAFTDADLKQTIDTNKKVDSAALRAAFMDLQNQITALKNAPPSVPTGSVQAYAGAIDATHPAPEGWVVCDGTPHNATTETKYAALYGVIQKTYGNAGGADGAFNLPDLTGRTVFGHDPNKTVLKGVAGGIDGSGLGNKGGEAVHALNLAESPSHSHGPGSLIALLSAGLAFGVEWQTAYMANSPWNATSNWKPSSTSGTLSDASGDPNTWGVAVGGATGGVTAESPADQVSGAGGGHNTIPPGIVLNYIIKL